MSSKSVFVLGPGLVGWSLLEALKDAGYTDISVLVRRKEQGESIQKVTSDKIKIIQGSLDDAEIISKAVAEHHITFQTASADHLPSILAVLEGLKKRADQDLESIYIHTSGAAVLADKSMSEYKSPTVYTDADPKAIDALEPSQPHRDIDLTVANFSRSQTGDKTKIAIMIPPLIYGYNPAHDRLTVQMPKLARFALKHGFSGHVGAGHGVSGAVHVLDLARGYITLLEHLLDSSTKASTFQTNPYIFCENGVEYDWKEVAQHIGASLKDRGLIESAEPREISKELWGDIYGEITPAVFGMNARSKAERLRSWGWESREKSVWQSWVDDELPALLKQEGKA